MNSIVENCKVVLDTIHFVSYDTVHQVYYKTVHQVFKDTVHNVYFDTTYHSLDTSLSFEAFKYAHDAYKSFYDNMQSDMSNIIMVFAFIVAILTLIFGAHFLWQNGAGFRFFNRFKKEMKTQTEDAVSEMKEVVQEAVEKTEQQTKEAILNFKESIVKGHLRMGLQFLEISKGKSSIESLKQFYLSLNHLIDLDFDQNRMFVYESVLDGIEKNQMEAKSTMLQNLLESLNLLKQKIGNQSEELKKKIDSLCKLLEIDDSDESDDSSPEKTSSEKNGSSATPSSINEMNENETCDIVNSPELTEQKQAESIVDEQPEDDDDSGASIQREIPKETDTPKNPESKDDSKGGDSPK